MDELDEHGRGVVEKVHATLDAVGAGAGALIGVLVGGPIGAIGGAVAGATVSGLAKGVVGDVLSRRLSVSEGRRLEKVVLGAAQDIHDRLSIGEMPRQDWFNGNISDREEASEIFEGVLTNAQREYEDRKLVYYAHLLSSIAFKEYITRTTANKLIKLGSSLSYRQIGLIALFKGESKKKLRYIDYRNNLAVKNIHYNFEVVRGAILADIFEMHSLYLIDREDGTTIVLPEDIIPSGMRLKPLGEALFDLEATKRVNRTGA